MPSWPALSEFLWVAGGALLTLALLVAVAGWVARERRVGDLPPGDGCRRGLAPQPRQEDHAPPRPDAAPPAGGKPEP